MAKLFLWKATDGMQNDSYTLVGRCSTPQGIKCASNNTCRAGAQSFFCLCKETSINAISVLDERDRSGKCWREKIADVALSD